MAANSSIYDIETFLVDVEKWKEELENVRSNVEGGKVPKEKYETAKIKYLNDIRRNLKFINKFDSQEQKSVILQLGKKVQNSRKITPELVNEYLNENFGAFNKNNQITSSEVVEENTSSFKIINDENNQKVENAIAELNELNLKFEELYNQDITNFSQEQLEQRRKKLEDFQSKYKELKSALNNIKQKTRNHIKGIGDDKEEEKKLDLELINNIEKESISYMEPLQKIELQLENMKNPDDSVKQEENLDVKEQLENDGDIEFVDEIDKNRLQDEEFHKQSIENEASLENMTSNDTQSNPEEFDESLKYAKEYADYDEQRNQEQYDGLNAQSQILAQDEMEQKQVSVNQVQKLTDEEFYKQSLENEANFEKIVNEYGEVEQDELAIQEDLKNAENFVESLDDDEIEQNEEIDEGKDDLEENPDEKNYDLIIAGRIGKYLGEPNGKDVHELEENLNLMNNYISRNVEPGTKEYRNIRKVFKRIYYDDVDFNGDEFVSKLFSDGSPQYIKGKISREDREIVEESINRYKKMSVDGKIPESEMKIFDKFVLAPYRLKSIVKSKNIEKEEKMVTDLKSQTVSEEELLEDVEFEEVEQRRKKESHIK